jgi:dTDP-4-dehydrorhamnose reductase
MVARIEMWGGVECTVNRVADQYFDQMERSGHARRLSDLDLIAATGIKTLRYPVLWEKVAPHGLQFADWSWTDERLNRLRELGIEPIVGLLHHGSGPRSTSLVDPNFPMKFAKFAGAVAERYPWVTKYTPVNEPLTTARFSGLYGHWYPHGKDNLTFGSALLNECQGTVEAMREIRQVNPAAQLIQTEDMGKTYSTPPLRYQAEFENERRWASLDLLSGKLTPDMVMFRCFAEAGLDQRWLGWFLDNPCPPDIIGINHYVTSERFIDHRWQRYPKWSHGGNGTHSYADVEAVRVCNNVGNVSMILAETWERYKLPLAITEAHLGDTLEEQQRWLWERWQTANELLDMGVDIRAVTVWAMFGSFDWHRLCTRIEGHYEPGVFDVRTEPPTPSGLDKLIGYIIAETDFDYSVLTELGWWRRQDRYHHPMVTIQMGIGPEYCVCDWDHSEETADAAQATLEDDLQRSA